MRMLRMRALAATVTVLAAIPAGGPAWADVSPSLDPVPAVVAPSPVPDPEPFPAVTGVLPVTASPTASASAGAAPATDAVSLGRPVVGVPEAMAPPQVSTQVAGDTYNAGAVWHLANGQWRRNADLVTGWNPAPTAPDADVLAAVAARPANGTGVRVFLVDDGIREADGWRTATSAVGGPGLFPWVYEPGVDVTGEAGSSGDGRADHCTTGGAVHGRDMARNIMATAPGAVIVPVRVFTCGAAAADGVVVDQGLDWILAHARAGDVVSASLGNMAYSTTRARLDALTAAGVVSVVASDNTNLRDLCTTSTGWPGDHTADWQAMTSLVVSGVGNGSPNPSGSMGPCIEVVAPLDNQEPGGFPSSGVSNSTSYAAGVIAAWWSGTRGATAVQVLDAVLSGPLSVRGGWLNPPLTTDRQMRISGAPSAPYAATATASGSGQVTLAWQPPIIPGAPLTSYTVAVDGTPTAVPSCTGLAASAAGCVLTGLTAGPHLVSVKAVNPLGTSPDAGWTATAGGGRVPGPLAVTVITVPSAPTIRGVSAGIGQVSAGWNASASDGGSAVLDYLMVATPTSGPARACTITITSCTLTGFTAGVPVTVTVQARNAAGVSPFSAPSTPVTPTAAPSGGGGSPGGGGSSSGGGGGGAAALITEVRPAFGPTTGGTTILVLGYGMWGASGVTIGGRPATAFRFIDAATVEVVTPPGELGWQTLVVKLPVGDVKATFRYDAPAPTITPTVTPPRPDHPALTPSATVTARRAAVRVVLTAATGTSARIIVRRPGAPTARVTVKGTGGARTVSVPLAKPRPGQRATVTVTDVATGTSIATITVRLPRSPARP